MTGRPHLKSADSAMPPLGAPQMQHLYSAQSRIFEETGRFADAWFGRRRSMAEALGTLGADMAEAGGDTSRIAEAVSRWQTGSQERLAADMRDWMTLCTNCTGHFAREASASENELLDSTLELARRTGRTRHATPV